MIFFVLGVGSQADARPLYLDYLHVAPPHRQLTVQEEKLYQRIDGWFRAQKLAPPLYDVRLREATWRLADRLARKPMRQLPHQLVQTALWLGSSSDHQIRIFGMAYTQEEKFWNSLSRALSTSIAGHRPTHVGFALVGKQPQIGLLLWIRRGAHLAPFLRWGYVGQTLTLQGSLESGAKQPTWVIGTADGQVHRPQVSLTKTGTFVARWTPKHPGVARLQVIISNEEGPWISAQWDLRIVTQKSEIETIWSREWRRHLAALWSLSPGGSSPSPPPASATVLSGRKLAEDLWRLVNRQRNHHQLSTLHRDIRLDHLARSHARDMIREGYFGHTSPQRGSFRERFHRLGWFVSLARENIVVADTPEQAYKLLLQSPVHRKNLLDGRFTLTGVGATRHPSGRYYFVQVFVRP